MTDRQAIEAALVRSVDGDRLMAHVRRIARWERHAGTTSEREAFAYVADVMRGYGYDTRLLIHDAFISLPGKAQLEWAESAPRARAHSFSQPSPPGGLEGDVIYVGAGGASELAARDVRGRILLVDGVASPSVSLAASRAGAVGQIHVSPHEHLHDMCVSPVWGSPTDEDLDRLPKTVILSIAREDGEALKRALARAPQRARLRVTMDTGWRETRIVQADLRAGEPWWLMFSGHHCAWYHGAMDNGGATATMLEIARLLAERRGDLARGVRLLFWSGHSQGRYSSSTWYADAYWREIYQACCGHVNVDSTGGAGNTVVSDTTAMTEFGALADDVLTTYAGQRWSGRAMQRAGDQSFWGIGVSCLFANMSEQPLLSGRPNPMAAVFGGEQRAGAGTGWWWHTPDDTIDKIDEEILARDTRIYLGAVWRILSEPVLPIDFAATAREIADTLRAFERAGADFDLSSTIRQAERVGSLASTLRHAAAASAARARRVNQCLVQLQRVLVPIRYARAGPFDQDPALAVPLVPALDPVRRLARLDPRAAEARHLTVRLMRARNRVEFALAQAEAVLCDALRDISVRA